MVRQVAGDTRNNIESSLVSAQLQGRLPFLAALGKSKRLPSIESLQYDKTQPIVLSEIVEPPSDEDED